MKKKKRFVTYFQNIVMLWKKISFQNDIYPVVYYKKGRSSRRNPMEFE